MIGNCGAGDDTFHEHKQAHDVLVERVGDDIHFGNYQCTVIDMRGANDDSDSDSDSYGRGDVKGDDDDDDDDFFDYPKTPRGNNSEEKPNPFATPNKQSRKERALERLRKEGELLKVIAEGREMASRHIANRFIERQLPNSIGHNPLRAIRSCMETLSPILFMYLTKQEIRNSGKLINKAFHQTSHHLNGDYYNALVVQMALNLDRCIFNAINKDIFLLIDSFLSFSESLPLCVCDTKIRNVLDKDYIQFKRKSFTYNHGIYRPHPTHKIITNKNGDKVVYFYNKFKNYILGLMELHGDCKVWLNFIVRSEFTNIYLFKSQFTDVLDSKLVSSIKKRIKTWKKANENGLITVNALANPFGVRAGGATNVSIDPKLLDEVWKECVVVCAECGSISDPAIAGLMKFVIESYGGCECVIWLKSDPIPKQGKGKKKIFYVTREKLTRFRRDYNLDSVQSSKTKVDLERLLWSYIPFMIEFLTVSSLFIFMLSGNAFRFYFNVICYGSMFSFCVLMLI